MNFDLDQLRMFDAVMRLRNFRSAAHLLGVAQSSLSQRIARLEAELGLRLFERTTRTVEPTPHGLALHPHARDLLSYVAGVQEAFHVDDRPSQGRRPRPEGCRSVAGLGATAPSGTSGGPMTDDDQTAALHRIAAILRVPASAFFNPTGGPAPVADAERIGRARAIVEILTGIPDRQERARCLERVRRILEGSTKADEANDGG